MRRNRVNRPEHNEEHQISRVPISLQTNYVETGGLFLSNGAAED